MAVDERAEQTPEGEGSIVATKTARKLQLEDDNDEIMITSEERGDSCSLSSSAVTSSWSPLHRSPFQKSPQAMSSHFQTDSEITVRKQLFPSNGKSERLNSFRFSSSKKLLSSAKVGGQNPFALLDQSQKFTGGADSENKKCFVLTNNADDVDISLQDKSTLPQTDCIEIDSDQDTDQDTDPSLQNSTGGTTDFGGGEAKSSSFPYMTSKDFITAHPCTQGQPSVDEKPAVLQRSQSVAEMMLQPTRVRATSSTLMDLDGRGSAIPSTNSTKVYVCTLTRNGRLFTPTHFEQKRLESISICIII